jgi:hypothetical protein
LCSSTAAVSRLDKHLNKEDTNVVSKCTLPSSRTLICWLDLIHVMYVENLCLSTKIIWGICTPVECVLLFIKNNTILTTSSRYRSGSSMQHIYRCRRNSLSIFTSVLFVCEFLAKSNANMSFSDSTYSEMSRSKFLLKTI